MDDDNFISVFSPFLLGQPMGEGEYVYCCGGIRSALGQLKTVLRNQP